MWKEPTLPQRFPQPPTYTAVLAAAGFSTAEPAEPSYTEHLELRAPPTSLARVRNWLLGNIAIPWNEAPPDYTAPFRFDWNCFYKKHPLTTTDGETYIIRENGNGGWELYTDIWLRFIEEDMR